VNFKNSPYARLTQFSFQSLTDRVTFYYFCIPPCTALCTQVGNILIFLVSTRQRGNAVSNAPTLRERDAGASRRHSHAGAWEQEETYWCA